MKVISKDFLIKNHTCNNVKEVFLDEDTFVTREAFAYAEEFHIKLIKNREKAKVQENFKEQKSKFSQKPEHMTHLNGKDLVEKSHPRIKLRGKLDIFQALVLETIILIEEKNIAYLKKELEEVLAYSRNILVAEVAEMPLEKCTLFGLNEDELRYVSQNPKEYFDIGHIPPEVEMGKVALRLNLLRAQSREVELAAIDAFCKGNCQEREDILIALNRLSSGIYIMFCKYLAQKGFNRKV